MTTTLCFEAPADLSVGRIRIHDARGPIADWMATPDDRKFHGKVRPGFYKAEITPVGVPPQAVIFEVQIGAANNIVAPSFSFLRASGSNTTFLDVADQAGALTALFGKSSRPQVGKAKAAKGALIDAVRAVPLRSSKKSFSPFGLPGSKVAAPSDTRFDRGRRLSVGLAQEGAKPDDYKPFQGVATMELADGRLELNVAPPSDWSADIGRRVRLSVAIQDVRVERLLLPLYRGGVRVTILPSRFSTNDVELEILPTDPRLRALARALMAGTKAEAEAVRSIVGRTKPGSGESETGVIDPWERMLSALLSIRFPDVFPVMSEEMARDLATSAPWAYDVHVIHARQILYAPSTRRRADAAPDVLRLLRKAQTCGSPYFAYVNQLFAEMIDGLAGHFADIDSEALGRSAARVRARWMREQPLQSTAGPSFSWLGRDETLLAQGVLAPNRRSSGTVSATSNTVLFKGRVVDGKLRLEGERPQGSHADSPKGSELTSYSLADSFVGSPALKRPEGPEDDPNAGRFGGRSQRNGYATRVRFDGDDDDEWVDVTITVVASASASVPPDAVAWFCLYKTFDPQWIKVLFVNGQAELTFLVWGGFTVGVWLPHADVELETDLSKCDGAPRVLRIL
jgi:hypothetical protein